MTNITLYITGQLIEAINDYVQNTLEEGIVKVTTYYHKDGHMVIDCIHGSFIIDNDCIGISPKYRTDHYYNIMVAIVSYLPDNLYNEVKFY
jgi:hypothetical protein